MKLTWKNPHSLQARWSLGNSELPDSWESKLCMSITGIWRVAWDCWEMRSFCCRCWGWKYLCGTLDTLSLDNSWTDGTKTEVPDLLNNVSIPFAKQHTSTLNLFFNYKTLPFYYDWLRLRSINDILKLISSYK